MIVVSSRRLIIGCTLFFLSSCTQFLPATPQEKAQAIKEITKQAETFASQGKLSEALLQWEIAEAINSNNPELIRRITDTRILISEKATEYRQKAESALRRGNVSQAKMHFLAALALEPSNTTVLASLREIEKNSMLKTLSAKTEEIKKMQMNIANTSKTKTNSNQETQYYLALHGESEQQGRSQKQETNSLKTSAAIKETNKDQKDVAEHHFQLAIDYYNEKQFEEALNHFQTASQLSDADNFRLKNYIKLTQEQLAEKLYQAGLGVYRNNIDEAIKLWQQSAAYGHSKAKLQLRNAHKMKEKLIEIREKSNGRISH